VTTLDWAAPGPASLSRHPIAAVLFLIAVTDVSFNG
jgi:hypothetical protein